VDRLRALLLADDEERRAIERALHDGIQQRLVALAVELQVAQRVVESDPAETTRSLESMREDVLAALDEIRALAHRVHPPLLDTQGLVPSLRMAASAAPAPVRLEATLGGDDVPPEVAVTAYRCCVAALAGAVGGATVAVRGGGGELEIEIATPGGRVDDGALQALAGRFEALGGSLEVAPARVAGRLPLTPPGSPRPGT
jgi:glucose-6-phosphate-specific signal transduction histidine kinase